LAVKKREMYEISKAYYDNVMPLYLLSDSEFPLIRSVIERKQEGRIFADRKSKPNSCVVFNKFGFTYLFGDTENHKFNIDLAQFILMESALNIHYLLWYKPPDRWIRLFDRFSGEPFQRRERIRYKFQNSGFSQRKILPVPSNHEVKRIDKDLVKQMEHFNIDFPTRFWRSAEDFLENGFGFCIPYEKTIAGICYTACVSGGLAEVDIVTVDSHRNCGVGGTLALVFIDYCSKHNIEPTWDCFAYNEPSKRIAENLGFVKKERYPLYSFNRPFSPSISSELLSSL